jgi:hypothetical protein
MRRHFSTLIVLPIALLLASAVACDPVHSNAVDALGGEAPNVRRGPTHRPGQPCLLCHDGKPGDPGQFSVAGTVFSLPNDISPTNGVNGASVIMTDATGAKYTATTNAVGNFYITSGQWTPSYPMHVEITYGGKSIKMTTHIGRDGSCAGCHAYPVSWDSAGPIAITWPDGGVP